MFLGIISSYTTVANTAIPFVTDINSNNKISNNSGVISFNKSGYYNIDCNLTVTGVQNDVAVTEYTDGSARIQSQTTLDATDDFDTLTICDAIKVVRTASTDTAQIKFVPSIAGATVTGTLRIEYVQ